MLHPGSTRDQRTCRGSRRTEVATLEGGAIGGRSRRTFVLDCRADACASSQCADHVSAKAEATALMPTVTACWDGCVEGIKPAADVDAGQ